MVQLAQQKPGREPVKALADISHSRYVVIATKSMHRLQIRPSAQLEGNPTIPPSYIQVCAVRNRRIFIKRHFSMPYSQTTHT